MKVKIFNDILKLNLENLINKFIEDKEVIDIKYSTCKEDYTVEYSALIMYKE